MNKNEIFLFIGALVAAYQLWVSVLIIRAPLYEPRQKLFQVAGIWLIPLMGAIIVHCLLITDGTPPYRPEKAWAEPTESPANSGSGPGNIGE